MANVEADNGIFYSSIMVQRFFLPALCVGILHCVSLSAQSSGQGQITTPYQFPNVAVTKTVTVPEAWKRAQIPDDVLKRLTTDALLQSCLKFPFLLEIYASSSPQKGFSFMLGNFNGLQELFKRPDAAPVMLKLYQTMLPGAIERYPTPVEKGGYSFELSFLEIFLAQREILRRCKKDELKILAGECIKKHDEKQQYPKGYGGLSLVSTGFVMARMLELQSVALRAEHKALSDEGSLSNLNDLAELYRQTKLFAEGK